MRKMVLMTMAIGLLLAPATWASTEYFWVSYSSDTLQQFNWDSSTGSMSVAGTATITGGNTQDIEVKDNVLYVADYNTQKIVMIDAITRASLGDYISLGYSPAAMDFDASGNLWVSEYGTNHVKAYDSSGTQVGGFNVVNNADKDLEFGPNGNIFVSRGGNLVEEYSTSTGFVQNFVNAAAELQDARQLCWTADGNLLVADRIGSTAGGNGEAELFNGSTAAHLLTYGTTDNWNEIIGVGEDGAGDVLEVGGSGWMPWYHADGSFGNYTTNANGGGFIEIVPEPATMGLLLIGGLLGLIRRR